MRKNLVGFQVEYGFSTLERSNLEGFQQDGMERWKVDFQVEIGRRIKPPGGVYTRTRDARPPLFVPSCRVAENIGWMEGTWRLVALLII
jgi:hypothetical protein